MLKKILIVLGVIVVIVVAALYMNGAFQKIDIQQGKEGPYRLMGIYHQGPYQDIGKVFHQVGEACRKIGWKDSTTKKVTESDRLMFGVYFDDPETVPEDSLRSFAAVQIMSSEDSALFAAALPGASIVEIPNGSALICDQKTSGMMSMVIAAMRVYPAFGKFAEANPPKTPISHVFEIYHPGRTRFVMLSAD